MAAEGTGGFQKRVTRAANTLQLLIAITVLTACVDRNDVQRVELVGLQDQSARIDLTEHQLTVIFFLSPECPLCSNYSRSMKLLAERFERDSVGFYGIFSGAWVTKDEILGYRARSGVGFPMFQDIELRLAKALRATITPEVFVLNREGEVLYSGAIDNWMNELGRKKLEVTEHYLHDALLAGLKGERPAVAHTRAVGCLIE